MTSHYTKYTSDLDLLTFLEITISKMDHTYKTQITVSKQEVHNRNHQAPRHRLAVFNVESRNVTITPTDLLQPKDETKKPTQVASNTESTDPSKYAHPKGIRTNPKTVKIHDLEFGNR